MNPPIDQEGLPVSIQKVLALARKELHPSAILLYGSRARGTANPTSDFDFAVQGVEDELSWIRFFNYLNHDAPTLYGIDLVRYECSSAKLKNSIDAEGRIVRELPED